MITSFGNQTCHDVADASHIGEVRRHALALAVDCGLDETARSRVAIVATELATNIVRHAVNGSLLMQTIGAAGVEMIAFDHGPGMASVDQCLADGFSTTGTSGNGLGAIRRLSDEFDIWSAPSGTAVFSRVVGRAERKVAGIAGICIPVRGETACGDAWAVRRQDSSTLVLVVDGLGHGPEAAKAAQAAVSVFRDSAMLDTRELVQQIHSSMQGTRGGAVALARIDSGTDEFGYCAVGNIAGRVQSADNCRGLLSNNGIVGGQFRRIEEIRYGWKSPARLILHSDGLQTRWALDSYPGLIQRHPAIVAAVLYRDFCRGHDDATVVVLDLPAANDP